MSEGEPSRRRPNDTRTTRVIMFGKRAPNHLLPTDRPRFSNHDCDKVMGFEQVTLPPDCSWTTSWRIDKSYTDCDDEGWSYATDFPRFKCHLARGKSGMKRLGASVRRRRWIQMMAYVPPDSGPDSGSTTAGGTTMTHPRTYHCASQGSSSSSMGS
ncbi:hypothetical protein PsorP6_015352 [Peronosclerospora sorghi]|uniref:Uncharacterized protein n=1 Tax=Peronosclerospora sorghi TaxID=230839 RepID=A0ACC0WR20_9STRA|nr:hypothetical protein PsorP6_015352 [Peronosclerospora sorghi]